jgi:hypothetical protein
MHRRIGVLANLSHPNRAADFDPLKIIFWSSCSTALMLPISAVLFMIKFNDAKLYLSNQQPFEDCKSEQTVKSSMNIGNLKFRSDWGYNQTAV